jgi:hypothetical protein
MVPARFAGGTSWRSFSLGTELECCLAMLGAILLLGITTSAPPRNACELLTPRDVRSVQGEAFQSTKLTESNERGLSMSQCFYVLPSFARSVSIDVMRGKTLDFWREHFAEGDAQAIRGLGDAAVWSGNATAGALYVLRGDTVLRVSVGGSGTADEKIARSKKLAARALKRL